ncbi:hypothetical protein L218DRAFT_513695 [Marasmius fiardii PR-910]|nr:hypothetical protein L218DRAFT_513695 [Marasmius fiardii PR-910]
MATSSRVNLCSSFLITLNYIIIRLYHTCTIALTLHRIISGRGGIILSFYCLRKTGLLRHAVSPLEVQNVVNSRRQNCPTFFGSFFHDGVTGYA